MWLSRCVYTCLSALCSILFTKKSPPRFFFFWFVDVIFFAVIARYLLFLRYAFFPFFYGDLLVWRFFYFRELWNAQFLFFESYNLWRNQQTTSHNGSGFQKRNKNEWNTCKMKWNWHVLVCIVFFLLVLLWVIFILITHKCIVYHVINAYI